MADCGCHTGGAEGWNQAWRGPLRHALDVLRDWGIEVFERRGRELLRDPWAARDDYLGLLIGAVGLGRVRRAATSSATATRPACCSTPSATRCSCTRRAAGSSTTWPASRPSRSSATPPGPSTSTSSSARQPPVDAFLDVLAEARSNDPEHGAGRELWHAQVLPR